MIDIKSATQIHQMQEAGRQLGCILQKLLNSANAGVSLLTIESLAQKLIHEAGGTPSFQTVKDYKWATCLCVNDVVVHGIPNDYILKPYDILTIDVGMFKHDLHTDTAWSKIIPPPDETPIPNELLHFLRVGEETFWQAIAAAKVGNHVGHISQTIQQGIESAGYSIVKSLVGHGVGRSLHEDPQIPGYVRGNIQNSPLLKEGMTIAIEVIYAMGEGKILYDNDDGWTLATQDGSLTAVFEHTIAITQKEPIVITQCT